MYYTSTVFVREGDGVERESERGEVTRRWRGWVYIL